MRAPAPKVGSARLESVRRGSADGPLAEQAIHRTLGGGLLDVLAPGGEPAGDAALGRLAIARPANAPVLEQQHLRGPPREGIAGDDGAGDFDRPTTEQSETHVTRLPVSGCGSLGESLWITQFFRIEGWPAQEALNR